MRRSLGVVLLLLGVLACGDDDAETADPPPVGPTPVVVDTDGGSDDAMALLYLLQRSDIAVLGITVSGTGIVHCDPGVANVAGLVELAAPGADIPIACGAEQPLAGDRAFPDVWREQADGRYGGIFPAGTTPGSPVSATDVLASVVDSSAQPVTVLTLGPLTNLAAAITARPDLVSHIAEVVVMGGAFDVGGNVALDDEPAAASAEWNIYVDPAAAQVVLDSDAAVTFVPLDSQVPIDLFDVRALGRQATTPAGRAVARLLASSPFFLSDQFALWDPLAAAAVADPGAFSFSSRAAHVLLSGPESGRTVSGTGRPVRLARPTERETFLTAFLGTLAGLGRPLEISTDPDVTVTVAGGRCAVSTDTVRSGMAVLGMGITGMVAIGTLADGRTPADVDSYLATSPAGPPDWFPVVALLQPVEGRPASALVELRPGDLDVVCIAPEGTALRVVGTATLTVIP